MVIVHFMTLYKTETSCIRNENFLNIHHKNLVIEKKSVRNDIISMTVYPIAYQSKINVNPLTPSVH